MGNMECGYTNAFFGKILQSTAILTALKNSLENGSVMASSQVLPRAFDCISLRVDPG